MCETVHFNFKVHAIGLLNGLVFPMLIIAPALLLAKIIWSEWKPMTFRLLVMSAGAGLLCGCVLSECWIQVDETMFDSEISKAAVGMPYTRPRAWPNQGCSLVYIPGSGVHATD